MQYESDYQELQDCSFIKNRKTSPFNRDDFLK